jgi:hypothetical protein
MKLPLLNNINMTYIIFILVILTALVEVPFAVSVTQKLNNQQSTIQLNQAKGTNAVKTYIACLLTINPQSNIKTQEAICFNKAPMVKP